MSGQKLKTMEIAGQMTNISLLDQTELKYLSSLTPNDGNPSTLRKGVFEKTEEQYPK
jgi:hypothetical protein